MKIEKTIKFRSIFLNLHKKMITFKIDTKDLEDKLDKLTRIDKNKIHEGIGMIIENHVIEKIDALGLVDTGAFKTSVTYDVEPTYVFIHSDLHYSRHLEYGTRPHIIKPRHKKALKFEVDGHTVVTKKVKHPGTREYAPFRRGLIDSQVEVTAFVRESIINLTS